MSYISSQYSDNWPTQYSDHRILRGMQINTQNPNSQDLVSNETVNTTIPKDFEQYPLGMSYVPWQQWKEPYDLNTAFHAGTIFPELDMPFTGRCEL